MGVLIGFLGGSSMSMVGAAWLRHTLRFRPERVFAVQVGCTLSKMGVLFMGAFAFRYLQAASARVDWRSFLLSFILSVLLMMVLGTIDNARYLKDRQRTLKESQAL